MLPECWSEIAAHSEVLASMEACSDLILVEFWSCRTFTSMLQVHGFLFWSEASVWKTVHQEVSYRGVSQPRFCFPWPSLSVARSRNPKVTAIFAMFDWSPSDHSEHPSGKRRQLPSLLRRHNTIHMSLVNVDWTAPVPNSHNRQLGTRRELRERHKNPGARIAG
ncbi:hypothetical protein BC567DRAFT_3820 [Phyllosticta citribraziliensis]